MAPRERLDQRVSDCVRHHPVRRWRPSEAADPSAIGIAGPDRYATSGAVALAFFATTAGISVASGANFPDALAAGPVVGSANQPMLLVPETAAARADHELSDDARRRHRIGKAFGGTTAIADAVVREVAQSIATG